jgi:hypothetical protein
MTEKLHEASKSKTAFLILRRNDDASESIAGAIQGPPSAGHGSSVELDAYVVDPAGIDSASGSTWNPLDPVIRGLFEAPGFWLEAAPAYASAEALFEWAASLDVPERAASAQSTKPEMPELRLGGETISLIVPNTLYAKLLEGDSISVWQDGLFDFIRASVKYDA